MAVTASVFLIVFLSHDSWNGFSLGARADSVRGKDPTLSSACHWQRYSLSSTKKSLGTRGPWEDGNNFFLGYLVLAYMGQGNIVLNAHNADRQKIQH